MKIIPTFENDPGWAQMPRLNLCFSQFYLDQRWMRGEREELENKGHKKGGNGGLN